MIGYTEPNRYQPRPGWKAKLDGWVQFPPPNVGSWQNDIALYWRWTTEEGESLTDAWTRLRMQPVNARSSLDPHSTDIGLIPPDLFSHVLARSRAAGINPNDDVAPVVIDAEPAAVTDEDPTEVGYTPPNIYRPRSGWRSRLDGWVQFPPANAGSWQMDISFYWRWTREGQSMMDAWTRLRMSINNARSSLDRNSTDRGMIPPELFSHVLARSQAQAINPTDNVADVVIAPEPT